MIARRQHRLITKHLVWSANHIRKFSLKTEIQKYLLERDREIYTCTVKDLYCEMRPSAQPDQSILTVIKTHLVYIAYDQWKERI